MITQYGLGAAANLIADTIQVPVYWNPDDEAFAMEEEAIEVPFMGKSVTFRPELWDSAYYPERDMVIVIVSLSEQFLTLIAVDIKKSHASMSFLDGKKLPASFQLPEFWDPNHTRQDIIFQTQSAKVAQFEHRFGDKGWTYVPLASERSEKVSPPIRAAVPFERTVGPRGV